MMIVKHAPQTHPSKTPITRPRPVEVSFTPLLITFLLEAKGQEIKIRCRGCREIIPLAQSTSNSLMGMIELDGRLLPVIDPHRRVHAEETEIDLCSCIVVLRDQSNSRTLYTGVILHDIDEVMHLAAGSFPSAPVQGTNSNIRFVAQTWQSPVTPEFITEAHEAMATAQEFIQTLLSAN